MTTIDPNDPDLAECIGHWSRSRWGKRRLAEGKQKLVQAAERHRFGRLVREADAEATLGIASDAAEENRGVELARILGDTDLLRVLEAK